MLDFYDRYKPQIHRIMFFVLITVGVFAFFSILLSYIAPFFVGLIIAFVINPLAKLMVRRLKLQLWLAALLSLIIFIVAMSSLGVWIVMLFIRQVVSFFETAPLLFEEVLVDANLWIERMSGYLPDGWYIPDMQGMLAAAGTAILDGGVAGQAIGFVGNVPMFVINLILTIVSAYFFVADREVIFNTVRRACPKWIAEQWTITKVGLSRAIVGFFKAQAILMVVIGAISVVGLLILGIPYALLIGILFAILDFIPMLGPAMVLIPWALFSMILGSYSLGFGLLILYGAQTVARQVLQPKIMGTQMGVHPLAFLISMFVGFRIFGIIGFVVGPSLLILFKAVKEADQDALYRAK